MGLSTPITVFMILISKLVEIGLDIAHNQGLQCITDRKPCCRNNGEWLLTNRTSVPIQDRARSYNKSSGNNGNVSLNLLTQQQAMYTSTVNWNILLHSTRC